MRGSSIVLLCAASCATTRASVAPLLEADRAFAAEARAHGIQVAFTRFAAEDAWVLKPGGALRGRAEVEKAFAGTGKVDLRWEPQGAEVSETGDVGYTWGTWTRQVQGDDAVAHGRYLTTWRKTAEGYRWTADLGDTDPPPAK